MSFDDSDMLGAFTELEIAAGVPDLVFGACNNADEDFTGEDDGALNALQSARALRATRMSERCESLRVLKMMLVKEVLNEELDYVIKRYSKKESLPNVYHGLIRQDQCLEVLIKGMLGKVAKINITSSLEAEVKEVVDSVLRNEGMETAYTRVGRIQRFVHEKIDEIYGEFSCVKLPIVHMKNLLSASRLHLSIREVSENNSEYLSFMMKKCLLESEKEDKKDVVNGSLRLAYLAAGKQYYPKWRVRHMRHISYYLKESSRKLISDIQEVDESCFEEKSAREKLVYLYCFHDPAL